MRTIVPACVSAAILAYIFAAVAAPQHPRGGKTSGGNPAIDAGCVISIKPGGADTSRLPDRDEPMGWDIVGTPRWGKWPGDVPDIGAYEWIPEELQGTNGDWNGMTLPYNPLSPHADAQPSRPARLRVAR